MSSVVKGLYAPRLLELLRENAEVPDSEDRRKGLAAILDEFLEPMFEVRISDQIEELKKHEVCYDHGLLGAANLAAYCQSNQEVDLSLDANPSLKAAVRAIALHNGPVCYPPIHAGRDPLAFLLTVCVEFQEWGRRIVVDDRALTECEQMRLIGIEKENSRDHVLGAKLTAIFEYPRPDTLYDTGWDYSKFSQSKRDALARINVPDDFPIQQLEYNVWMPHEVQFKKNKHDNGTVADEAESDGEQLVQSRL